MTDSVLGKTALFAVILIAPMVSQAAIVTVNNGTGFDDGWATAITYDTLALRGDLDERDEPTNALGEANGDFFEIGFESTADFTFDTSFDSSVSIFEVTFGDSAIWPESVEVWAGTGVGVLFSGGFVDNLANSGGGGSVSLSGLGVLTTIRLIDTSPASSSGQENLSGDALGGFDVDAVRVSPVPIPAAAWLFGSSLLGLGVVKRKKA